MKVGLLTSTLEGGGAARVIVNMANYWHRSGHSVVLYSFEDGSSPSFYPVNSGIQLAYLNLAKQSHSITASLKNNWNRLVTIRRAILQAGVDVVISFIDTANIRTLAAMLGSRLPVIVSERIDPQYEDIGRFWDALRLATYPFAAEVVVQTEAARRYFPRYLQRKITVIPNPVSTLRLQGSSPPLPANAILAVGRLYPQKGYDTLIQAFADVARRHDKWTLCIAGGGVLLVELEGLVRSLGLAGRVHFLGQVSDVGGLLEQAVIFVMSSRYEGFPNALCEAMASGLPCVSTDCPSGPGEIITNGEDGLLVPPSDYTSLANALERLIVNPVLRKELGEKARQSSQRYSEESVMAMWNDSITRSGVAL